MTTALELMDTMRLLLAEGRKIETIRLLPDLQAMLTGEAGALIGTFPVCAKCQGYAEVPHPSEANRKVSCAVHPDVCAGNQHGRMTPEQFEAYMRTQLDTRSPEERVQDEATYREMAENAKGKRRPWDDPVGEAPQAS